MRIIAIIPARHGSKRLFGKPLIEIYKKPLIQLTYEAVCKSKLFDVILVTTESKKIKKVATDFGSTCIITSENNKNGTERCAELIEGLNWEFNQKDIIVNIQCDEPFIQKKHLQKVINLCKKNAKIGTLISPIEKNEILDPSIVKVNTNTKNHAIDFRRDVTKLKKGYKIYKHIGVYGYTQSTLMEVSKLIRTKREEKEKLEQLRWLENNYLIHCAHIEENIKSINTENDIKKINKI